MSDDTKGFIAFMVVVAIAVISIPWSISYYYSSVTKAAIQAGYEQQTLQGESGAHWVKTVK